MIKTLTSEILHRRISPRIQFLSTSAPQFQTAETRLQSFRTNEVDPSKHGLNQLAQFYRLPKTYKDIFANGGLPRTFEIQSKTFNETCLMVRRPALDLINCLKSMDFSKPTVRFVLYGQQGSGKSLTMAHVLHYAHSSGFLIVHVPWVGNWMRRCKESSNSEHREGMIDLNLDAAGWLVHFKHQNENLLKNPEFKLSKEYVWSKRESTPKGSPLNELIDHGINRIRYASECVVALAEEIKNFSQSGLCKTLVAVDGYNGFFYPKPRIFTEKKEVVHPHKVTLAQAFLNLTKPDWNNSAVIVTVDDIIIDDDEQNELSYMPRYLLGKDGFEHLDPFVPILVNNFSSKEFTSCMDYYRERKWVMPVLGQDNELAALSNSNPYKLMQLCSSL